MAWGQLGHIQRTAKRLPRLLWENIILRSPMLSLNSFDTYVLGLLQNGGPTSFLWTCPAAPASAASTPLQTQLLLPVGAVTICLRREFCNAHPVLSLAQFLPGCLTAKKSPSKGQLRRSSPVICAPWAAQRRRKAGLIFGARPAGLGPWPGHWQPRDLGPPA